jgi:4-hydroxythreonine-4-phosphate dehydrogenase
MNARPLAISTGDPGGVGPEIAVRVALAARATDRLVLFGDAQALTARASALGAPRASLRIFQAGVARFDLATGELGFVDAGVPWGDEALAHHATARGGQAQLRALDCAIDAALQGSVRGLVTAPMSKHAVNLGGSSEFVGHTEHLARRAGLPDDAVSMLFLGARLRVALVTTHLSIAHVPAEITRVRVLRTLQHMAAALLRCADDARPRVLGVAGLNPHAGEAGLFGDEESRVLLPAMDDARRLSPFSDARVELRGPIPAETAFRIAADNQLDGVVAMFHDQATIASKLLDWGNAVNVTWGLPFVRTSVDHGVAYDAAASGSADAAGMTAALHMAQRLTRLPQS